MTLAAANLRTRRATVADADTVARLAVETFVEKFGHLYSAEDLTDYLRLAYGEQAILESLQNPSNATWLLLDGDTAVGFALIGPAGLPHPDIVDGDGEIKRFYVDPSRTGQGLGRVLMETVLQDLLKAGPRTLWLGVYSDNDGAQRFYQRYGFEHAGEYEFPVGETRDREFIYRRPA